MNIARASAADLEAALSLLGLLDTVSRGYYPSDPEPSNSEHDPVYFDEDDRSHLTQLWRRLKSCLDQAPGFQGRVIFGGVTMLDPRNRIIDERADIVQLHPSLVRVDDCDTMRPSVQWVDGAPDVCDDGSLVVVEPAADPAANGAPMVGAMPQIARRRARGLQLGATMGWLDYASVQRHIVLAG